jgi:pentose-5-phosphate-3-epimerase
MSTGNSWDALIAESANMDTPPHCLAELARTERLQIVVAGNPATPPNVLVQLSTAKDAAIRRAVVQNPNTPLQTLYALAGEFPQEFLRNPILPLLNMTRPQFVKEMPTLSWRSLLRFFSLPKGWLRQVQTDTTYQRNQEETWQLIQLHTASEIPKQWRQQADSQLRKYRQSLAPSTSPASRADFVVFLLFVSLFPYTAEMLKEQWLRAVPVAPREVGKALATNAVMSKKTVAQLAQETDTFILRQVARHPYTAEPALTRLATHRDVLVRRAVASNPRTPLKYVQVLASDNNALVRRSAASHPALTEQDQEILVLDEDGGVRAAFASLSRLAPALYAQLARDPVSEVRTALARNAKIPQELLSVLASDAEAGIRAAAASNPRLSTELMKVLLNDPAVSVRASLSGNARLTEECFTRLARDAEPKVRRYLAANPRTPVTLLARLQQTEEMEVWQGIARHPKTEPEVLERLARLGDQRVQIAVAAHPRTPLSVLDLLSQIDKREIWLALAGNLHTPLDILERAIRLDDFELWFRVFNHPVMVQRRPFLKLLTDEIRSLVATNSIPDWLRRAVLQYYTALPAQLLEPFAESPYWEERYLVARHPHTEAALLDKLAQDGIVFVRAAANDARSPA